jgi:hypothetical protein
MSARDNTQRDFRSCFGFINLIPEGPISIMGESEK